MGRAQSDIQFEKHGVAFEHVAAVFSDELSPAVFDEEHSDDEDRWFAVGMSRGGKLLAVAHTYRRTNLGGVAIRIISARPATKNEQRFYADEPRKGEV